MNVKLKNGNTKKYRLTLKMLGMQGTSDGWNDVDYQCIIDELEKRYPELKNNIDRAYL